MTTPSAVPVRRQLAIIRIAFLGAVVMIGVVATVVFGLHTVEPWTLVALLVALAAVVAGLFSTARMVRPLDRATPPERAEVQGRQQYTSNVLVRLAMAEAPAIIGFALAAASGTAVPALIGAGMAVVLLLGPGAPTRAHAEQVEQRLNAAGARSGLVAQQFGAGF